MKNKKAQEEVVGFVLIIVLVAVIFTIFLGIMIHNSSRDKSYDSKEYSQFISTLMEVNTPCVVYSPKYSKVSELMGYCLDSQMCLNGNKSCSVLNETITKALDGAILFGNDRDIKGYEFTMQYIKDNSTAPKSIIEISKGICNSSITGADYPLPHYPGIMDTTIKICY